MLNKSIPYKNIIMRADAYTELGYRLPEGYRLKYYEPGDEIFWAEIVTSVGEFDSISEAMTCFQEHYKPYIELLRERCVFVTDPNGNYAGTCTAWFDISKDQIVSSLHWFAVKPYYQNRGVGKAVLDEVMRIFYEQRDFPVYLHTQTWSLKAILLYIRAGFSMLRSETFGKNQNDYDEAMSVLRAALDPRQYSIVINASV